jgi:glutamyl-tRNA reductase
MIAEQTAHFLRWLEGRSVVPRLPRCPTSRRAPRRRTRTRAPNAGFRDAGRSSARGPRASAHQQVLHAPLAALNAAGDAERAELIASLSRVYKLPDPPSGES